MATTLEDVMKEIKALRKDVRKIKSHIEDPTGEKRAARSLNNGFKKPLDVTPELRSFLGLAADEKISRAEVTSRITKYATEKGLKNGQYLNLDSALKSLLNPPEGIQLTFMNMQTYLKNHYVKPPTPVKKTEAAAPVEAPAAPVKAPRPKVAKKVPAMAVTA